MVIDDALRDALTNAELDVEGRLLDASNAAYVCTVDGVTCVYKPVAGERELWDFPTGSLSRREVATFELAQRLGMSSLPPTVWREQGPAGPGMCQLWIEHTELGLPVDVVPSGQSPDGWRIVMRGQAPDGSTVELAHENSPFLREAALLDAIVNNADRKGGHILVDPDEQCWLIDHGVTFHTEEKLRTVLWGFAGDDIADDHLAVLADITDLGFLREYLVEDEVQATSARIQRLLETGSYPFPTSDWPPLPWPLF